MLDHITEHHSLHKLMYKILHHKFLIFTVVKEQSQPCFAPLLQCEIFTLEEDSLSDSMVAV